MLPLFWWYNSSFSKNHCNCLTVYSLLFRMLFSNIVFFTKGFYKFFRYTLKKEGSSQCYINIVWYIYFKIIKLQTIFYSIMHLNIFSFILWFAINTSFNTFKFILKTILYYLSFYHSFTFYFFSLYIFHV